MRLPLVSSLRTTSVRVAFVVVALAASQSLRAQSEQLRDSWQHVADLFAAAGARAGARVAGIGAGDRFLTVRLAQAVGSTGKVYAVDIDAKVADTLRERLAKAHL